MMTSLSRDAERPTNIRYWVLGLTTLVAVFLYLDRMCLSVAERSVKDELAISDRDMAWVLGLFYLPYALAQLPAGWLSDRFGARVVLGLCLAAWSAFTGLMGLANGLVMLIVCRLGCGLFEAAGYPAAVGLIGKWIPLDRRGFASGVVSAGGRLGGGIAPYLTAVLMLAFASASATRPAGSDDLLDVSGPGWRPVLMIYGGAGLAVAAVFFWMFRDSPRQHPNCNAAEIALIEGDSRVPPAKTRRPPLPFRSMLTSTGLWLASIVGFLTNLGWAFLFSWFPRYLKEAHQVPLGERGLMMSITVLVGMIGMCWGGALTDSLARRLGRRWGRSLPLSLSRFFVALAFASCVLVETPWAATLALAMVALGTDLGTPAIWAYSLDVGGKHVGAVLGWSNMFGNLGAFLSPIVLNMLIFDKNYDYVFLACAGAFVLAGVLSLFIDATKPVVPGDSLAA
jgi:ACS family glucarate transporter-like MFS transporter